MNYHFVFKLLIISLLNSVTFAITCNDVTTNLKEKYNLEDGIICGEAKNEPISLEIYNNGQELTEIPSYIFSITSLKELTIVNHKIESIPSQIKKLKNLETL
ncbi:hypothetical protein BCR32DRAFT_110050 [Anaeromyces robustus]|uniref:L domain-like protein n=1 Tax=Anaeromyces robustus TaxID=1754192 RepID=A0A1Y1XGM1_9FUNG|nr:hypothetical protein BCR32DRAFT_110050 [Anaeromyces robustus]|eukprot:ORX84873.1 hypothetical protein BCR32DRAFT_110050 [Anaeromyces robustus]